jgi:P27 family predicted phage terminase small subunit
MARPRKPTALKIIKGTLNVTRANKKEPRPARAIPSPPEHLTERARTSWAAVSVLLDRMGVLTEADGLVLEGLCEAYADLREARASLQERGGLTYEVVSRTGGTMVKAYPEVSMVADADRRLCSWLTKVGMTPADRSRVSAVTEKLESDPWAKLG